MGRASISLVFVHTYSRAASCNAVGATGSPLCESNLNLQINLGGLGRGIGKRRVEATLIVVRLAMSAGVCAVHG